MKEDDHLEWEEFIQTNLLNDKKKKQQFKLQQKFAKSQEKQQKSKASTSQKNKSIKVSPINQFDSESFKWRTNSPNRESHTQDHPSNPSTRTESDFGFHGISDFDEIPDSFMETQDNNTIEQNALEEKETQSFNLDTCNHEFIRNPYTDETVCQVCGLVKDEIVFANYHPYREQSQESSHVKKQHIQDRALKRAMENKALIRIIKVPTHRDRRISETKKFLYSYYESSIDIQTQVDSIMNRLVSSKLDQLRNLQFDLIVGLIFYHTHLQNQVPVSLAEVCHLLHHNLGLAVKYYHVVLEAAEISRPLLKPFRIIPLIITRLGLTKTTEIKAMEIVNEYIRKRGGMWRGNPWGLAAAAIYIAGARTNERIRQIDLAKKASVCTETIGRHSSYIARVLRKS